MTLFLVSLHHKVIEIVRSKLFQLFLVRIDKVIYLLCIPVSKSLRHSARIIHSEITDLLQPVSKFTLRLLDSTAQFLVFAYRIANAHCYRCKNQTRKTANHCPQ